MRQLRKQIKVTIGHAKYAAIRLVHSTMNLADSLLPMNSLTCLILLSSTTVSFLLACLYKCH